MKKEVTLHPSAQAKASVFFALLFVIFGLVGSAKAFTLSPTFGEQGLGVSKSLNAVIFGNAVTNGGHSDGTVAVRGNWTGSHDAKQHNTAAGITDAAGFTNVGVIVGGQVINSGNGLRSNNGKVIYNAIGSGGKVVAQNPHTTHAGVNSLAFFSQAEAELRRLQVTLSGLSSKAIDTSDMNNINVNVGQNALNGNLRVYSLNASQITGNRTLNFNGVKSSDTVVINVLGGTNVDWNWAVNGISDTKILWNFAGVQNININSRDFTGSLVAMDAHVTQNRNINGTLIAKDWTLNNHVELHFRPNEVVVGGAPALTPLPIPEPSSALLALLGLTFLLRRRR